MIKKGIFNMKHKFNQVTITGSYWTEERLKKICNSLYKSQKEEIISAYWEFIPDGDYTLDEKVIFVVCSIPNGASYPDSLVLMQLLQGSMFVNSKDYELAKPNIAKVIYEKIGKEQALNKVVKYVKKHKHCPVNNNGEWAMLIWLADMIDWHISKGIKQSNLLDILLKDFNNDKNFK